MTNETLRERVTTALLCDGPLHPDLAVSRVLAAIGLDDWEAAVDRAGDALADECQDRYGFRMALGQRQILAEIVLQAALTQPTDPVIPSSAERESRG